MVAITGGTLDTTPAYNSTPGDTILILFLNAIFLSPGCAFFLVIRYARPVKTAVIIGDGLTLISGGHAEMYVHVHLCTRSWA